MAENSSSERISQKLAPDSKGGGRTRGTRVGIIVFVGVVLIGVAVYLVIGHKEEQRNVVVTKDNVDEILAEQGTVEPGYYNVVMNTTWNFPNGDSPSNNAYVENDVANERDVYFDIVLADSEELIYSSPVLPLGSHIEDIALERSLEAGTYDCVCIYHLIDEEQNTVSTVRVSVTMVIEN